LGKGQNAPPSNEDIARVIVTCLTDPGPHIGKAHRPTGPRLLAPTDIAEEMGKALGRKIRYQNVPMGMFLKAAASLGISEYVITQLYWFLQDYQQNAFGIGAPTETVEDLTGRPPEDFETIARRYIAISPFAIRGLAGAIREVAGLAAAMLSRAPDTGKLETRLGVPRISNFALAADSHAWNTTHV
jgi:hypothetical protein